MKLGKKTTALLACSVGAVVFATAALADVAIGSGYNNLKNAAKETMARLTHDVENCQTELKLSLKLDGQEFVRDNVSAKYDMKNKRAEQVNETLGSEGVRHSYHYQDPTMSVYRDDTEEKYNVYRRETPREDSPLVSNPFEEEFAQDAEKVLDAFVGSLSDIVQMEELDDKIMYVGNLTETQVPTLINALTSFAVKYSVVNDYQYNQMKLPKIENDFCVRSASGKAIQDQSGMLVDALGTVTLAGTDKNGAEHELTAEISMSLTGIGTTEVHAPELTEENSDVTEETGTNDDELGQRYAGTYKNDIVELQNDTFVKVGERIMEITAAGDGLCSGRYYEVYLDGYTPKEPIKPFTFEREPISERYSIYGVYVRCSSDDGDEPTHALIRPYGGGTNPNLSLILNVELAEEGSGYSTETVSYYDETFVRVFE